MNPDKVIYAINIEDVQTVAAEQFGRELTENELNFVEDRLGDYINWYDSIHFALFDLKRQKEETLIGV